MSLYFCCTFLRDSVQLSRYHVWPTFHPATPNFFVVASLFILIACWKTNFFLMFMGNFWERKREREKFGLIRFPIVEAKSYFLQFCALTQTFYAVLARHRWEAIKEKASLPVIKNKEPGERNLTFWSLECILMFIFHEKCQSLGHVKMQNLPCNTPLFLAFLPLPEPL